MPIAPFDPNTPNLTSLQECIARESCVAFVGAGLSFEECGSWDGLIKLILERLPVECPRLENEDDATYYLRAADAVIGVHQWPAMYRVIYDKMANVQISGHYGLLSQIKFKHFVTTNFDHELSRSLRHRRLPEHVYPLTSFRIPEHPSCIYLHGKLGDSADDIRRLVLAGEHYKTDYSKYGPNSLFLGDLVSTHSICFVGSSVSDPPLVECLSALRSHREAAQAHVPGAVEVYAIQGCRADGGAFTQVRNQEIARWHQRGVRAICYQVSEDGRHHQLAQVLEILTGLPPLPTAESYQDVRRPTGGTHAL